MIWLCLMKEDAIGWVRVMMVTLYQWGLFSKLATVIMVTLHQWGLFS